MTVKQKKIALYILLYILCLSGFSQDINRNVVVVKPYEPSLSDVYKISSLPRIDDTTSVSPDFKYSIIPTRVDAPFELKPINAAKMVGLPMEKLYKSFLRLGVGNYYSALAEYNINTVRAKEHSLGASFFHKSSNSKLELSNGDDVPAGYSSNRGEAYANKYFPNTVLSGKAFFDHQVIHHYGYNTDLFTDTFPIINEKDTRQYYNKLGADFQVNSANVDSNLLNYNLGLGLDYLWDRFENTEGRIIVDGGLSKLSKQKVFGIDVRMDYVSSKLSSDSISTTITTGSPFFSKKNNEYEFLVGGRLSYATGEEDKLLVFPRAYLQINVVRNILMPYVGIDGNAVSGTYEGLINENPYINPGSTAKISDRMFAYGGVKGLLSSKAGYNFSIKYLSVNNMPFFINDSTGEWDNRFAITYDDMTTTSVSGEIYYDPSDDLKFLIKSNYYSNKPGIEAKAWHKPSFDLKFGTKYSFHDKLAVNFDLNIFGTRYAKPYIDTLEAIKLDPIIDFNLGIEYKYSKVLSIFLNVYNIGSTKYYYWNQYPSQRLNLIAGFSYKI